jgi:hypothetical protein
MFLINNFLTIDIFNKKNPPQLLGTDSNFIKPVLHYTNKVVI